MKKAVAAFLEKKAANSNEIGIVGGGGVRLEKEDFGGVPDLVAVAVASPFDFAVMSRLLLEGEHHGIHQPAPARHLDPSGRGRP